jgi:hypothetical protein
MQNIYATFEDARRCDWHGMIPATSTLLPSHIAASLRQGGRPTDREFDRFLPRRLRRISEQHWTPLRVVARAISWLNELGAKTVVDIGSGTGKFCIAGALLSRCHFVGIEQRADLVATSQLLANLYGVQDRVVFLQECFGEVAPPAAQAYYLFNPFGENGFQPCDWIDGAVQLTQARFERELEYAGKWLEAAPCGTYVLTYNGFGAAMPPSYTELRASRDLPCVLKLWRQNALVA